MKPFGAQKGHVVDFLFTLALFCVFAASALMVVVIGANVYRQTVRGMDSNYDSRTSLTYLTEKVRQNDAANAVTIRSVGDSPALVLSQQAGERTYETWIYVYDGYLREVFVAQGVQVKPTDGQPIKEQQSFLAEKEGSVLTLNRHGNRRRDPPGDCFPAVRGIREGRHKSWQCTKRPAPAFSCWN